MKKITNPKVAALIPDYWDLTASIVEDIVFFGKVTIRQMIRSWRSDAYGFISQIKDADEKLKFLQGKAAANIREIAKQYEKPEFPHVGVPKDSLSQNPEPLDAASINRKHDATTFNVCGWCKYASGGSCCYNCHITPSCSIRTHAGLTDRNRRFKTPCFLKKAPDKVFDEIRKGLTRERERLIKEKRNTDEKIKFLLTLEKRAEKKPALPDQRPHDWFNMDDPVVCYVGKWQERIVADDFVTAKVIDGYRHHDGCVSVYYDKRVHTGDYLEGHGGGSRISRPEVMHAWEFKYLLEYPNFAKFWAKYGAQQCKDFNHWQFLGALAKEAQTKEFKLGGLWKGIKITEKDIQKNRRELFKKLKKKF